MRNIVYLVVAAVLVAAPGAARTADSDAQRHEKALAAYEAGEFALALEAWKALADEGFAPALYYMAVLYRDGAGVDQDHGAARRWYRRAAEAGELRALHDLSIMHRTGMGTEPDPEGAVSWLRRAAEAGYAPSQYNLGIMYLQGEGVTEDPVAGYVWIYRAAEQGLEEALYSQQVVARELSLEQLTEARRIIESGAAPRADE